MESCTQDIDAIKNCTNNEAKELLTEAAKQCCFAELSLLGKQLSERAAEICTYDMSFNIGVDNCNDLKFLDIEYKNTLEEFNRTKHECDKLNIPKDEYTDQDHIIIDYSSSASSLEISGGILSSIAAVTIYLLL